MQNSSVLFAALLTASWVAAQTLPPSPTASVGCHAHEDHWHCDGPASSAAVSVTASTQTLTPSSSTTSPTSSTLDSEEHEEGTGSLAPSPTESVGCEPHGDHWHCDGAVVTSDTSAVQPTATAGAGKLEMANVAIIGGLLAAAGMGI